MKRILLLTLLLTLLVSGGLANAQENNQPDVTKLAQYVPDTSFFYMSIRIDDAYFAELDAIVAKFQQVLAPDEPPLETGMALNAIIEEITLESNTDDIRAMLGDTIAFTIPGGFSVMAGFGQPYLLVEIVDRDGIAELLTTVSADMGYDITETEFGTLYGSGNDGETHMLLLDEALIINDNANQLRRLGNARGVDGTLAASDKFIETVNALPADNYNFVGFFSFVDVLRSGVNIIERFLPEDSDFNGDTFLEAFAGQAFGGTVIDGRVLAFDWIISHGSVDVIEGAGWGDLQGVMPDTLDPEFARYATPQTAFYIQSSKAGSQIQFSLNTMATIGQGIIDDFVLPMAEFEGDIEAVRILEGIDFNDINVFVDNFLQANFRMSADEVFTTFDGQSAMIMTLTVPDDRQIIPENGQVFENISPENTNNVFDGLIRVLTDYRADFSVVDDNTIISTMSNPILAEMGGPAETSTYFRKSDEVFTYGTKGVTDFAINLDGESLYDSSAYQYDMTHFLAEPVVIMYINMPAVRESVVDLMQRFEATEEEIAMLDSGLSLVDSLAITASSGETSTMIRMSMTLSE